MPVRHEVPEQQYIGQMSALARSFTYGAAFKEQARRAPMTNILANTFRVAEPRGSWTTVQGLVLSISATLLLALVSCIAITALSLDPIEVAGETMWVLP